MASTAYPAPKRRMWAVQIEFHDGTTIDATSDDDAIDRWRRVAAWTDPTAITRPDDWLDRVLARAREFHAADLKHISSRSSSTDILDALAEQRCLDLRRK